MKRYNVCLLVFGFGLTLASPMAQAQGRSVEGTQVAMQPFKAELSSAQAKLATAEAAVERIGSTRRATALDTAAIDKGMYEYAAGFKALFERATREAELAARTNGRQGNIDNLLLFEEVASAEEKRVQKLAARLQALSSSAERGEVQLHTSSAASEPDERFLPLDPLVGAYDSFVACFSGGWESWELIPRAEAAIAKPCVPPCAAKNWNACLQCIVNKVPAAIATWNQFKNYWDSASGNGLQKAWKRAQCLATFIQKLA